MTTRDNFIKGLKSISIILALFLSLTSCKDKDFKIAGEIEGGANQSIVLEKSDFYGRWLPLDSIKIKDNGSFKFKFPAPGSPEIYRLSLGDGYIYVPIDSTETINVKSTYAGFGREFTLSGSVNAELMENFEKDLQGYKNISSADSLNAFKRTIYSKYMKDHPGSIVTFYILTKIINDKALYNPNDLNDAKYFAAVATGFKSMRPNDPHTELLEQTSLNAMKRRKAETGNITTLEAEEISFLEIELPDETGKNVKLSDVVGKGKNVLLIFSVLTASDSPEFNVQLAKIYNKYKGNIEFYNVAIDPDQYTWRDAAKNLPWITVYDPAQLNSETLRLYNVNNIPTIFVINRQGELVGRPTSLEEFEELMK